jgi:hypothetical protein
VLALSAINFTGENTKVAYHSPNYDELLKRWKDTITESLSPVLLALVFTAFIGILYSFLGHHIKNVLDMTGTQATMMFAKIILSLSLFAFFVQYLSIKTFGAKWRPRVIIGTLCLVIGTIWMMEAAAELDIWLSLSFIGIATALIPPAYLSLVSESAENNDKSNVFGKKLGLSTVAHSLGYAFGMGLISLSMKWKVIDESTVVFFISALIVIVCLSLFKQKRTLVYARS